jgi:hypothetical protein
MNASGSHTFLLLGTGSTIPKEKIQRVERRSFEVPVPIIAKKVIIFTYSYSSVDPLHHY